MTPALLILGAALLIAFGGFMAAIDAALGVTSRADLVELSQNGRNRTSLRRIAGDADTHANAIVFIRVLAETAAAVFVTVAFMLWLESIWWAMLWSILLMTGASFVLVGASPRSVGRRHATPLLRAGAPVVRFVRVALGPIARALVVLSSRVTPGQPRSASFASEEQLLSMVDEAAEADLIEDDDRELIHSVFDFTDTLVRSVMVPRIDMVAVDADITTEDAMTLFLATGVSRVPAFPADDDDVVGVLYLKDLAQFAFGGTAGWRSQSVRSILREPVFVPESMKAERLLQQMKRDAVHVCIVVDEHGGVSGLVTLEDLIEELVGDISDEYDARTADIAEVGEGRYRVSTRLSLDELGELFGVDLDDDEVDTVGGAFAKALGRVPLPGAVAVYEGIEITGGASRGRGRGLATVLVHATDALHAADAVFVGRSAEKRGDEDD